MSLVALRGRPLFRRITTTGFRQASRGTVVFWVENDLEHNRFGIAVRKAVGNAVRRNRIRRWAREYLRNSESKLRSGVDVVILVSREECVGSYEEFTDHLSHVFDLSYLRSSETRKPGQPRQSGSSDRSPARRPHDPGD